MAVNVKEAPKTNNKDSEGKKVNIKAIILVVLLVLVLVIGGIVIAKVLDNATEDERIDTFDTYNTLDFDYFLADEQNLDDFETPDLYYLFIYDATDVCESCSTSEQEKRDQLYDRVKTFLDQAIEAGIDVYVADISASRVEQQEITSDSTTSYYDATVYPFSGYSSYEIPEDYNRYDTSTTLTLTTLTMIRVEGGYYVKYLKTDNELRTDILAEINKFSK